MSDESLFREVDEEVRQEQFQKLWKRYGNHIMAACFVVVAGVAGFKGWQYWQVRQSEAAGTAFFEALKLEEAGKPADAAKAFAAIDHAGYGRLARLHEAAGLAAAGKHAEAAAAYDAIAADAGADPVLRDLAKVRAAYLLVDTLKPEELTARVGGLAVQDSQWRNPAREILALAAFRAGDTKTAGRTASEILADPDSTPAMRQRAQVLIQLLTPLLAKPAAP